MTDAKIRDQNLMITNYETKIKKKLFKGLNIQFTIF